MTFLFLVNANIVIKNLLTIIIGICPILIVIILLNCIRDNKLINYCMYVIQFFRKHLSAKPIAVHPNNCVLILANIPIVILSIMIFSNKLLQ